MCNKGLVDLDELPPVMVSRARWARKMILANEGKIEIDEDDFLAWVYHDEDGCWYSIAGNYSGTSPKQKMKKRRSQKKKRIQYEKDAEQRHNERIEQQRYWSAIRQDVLERDNYTCQGCEIQIEKFHIHHILPRKRNGGDTTDNLITVCPKCHSAAEKISKAESK